MREDFQAEGKFWEKRLRHLIQATEDWSTARVTLGGAQGLVCRREAALCSA